jgi:hypothetical protein
MSNFAATENLSFERKTLPDGTPNPKYVDLCDEDAPIAGQKFVCMSFVSPEKIIKQREMFLFEKFVEQWDFSKSMEKFSDFMNFLAYKYSLKYDDIVGDLEAFVKEERAKLTATSVSDSFKNFLDKNEDRLNTEFKRAHQFQTSTRGLKVRGVFNTQEEAEMRCKKLRESDPNHDIYVGPVGVWVPYDPDAYKTGRVEFMEEELNQLHHEKLKNEMEAKEAFDKRVKEAKRKAIEENVRLARAAGNKLTQTITEDGTLVGVKENVDFETREAADVDEVNRVNKELFERASAAVAAEKSDAAAATTEDAADTA